MSLFMFMMSTLMFDILIYFTTSLYLNSQHKGNRIHKQIKEHQNYL